MFGVSRGGAIAGDASTLEGAREILGEQRPGQYEIAQIGATIAIWPPFATVGCRDQTGRRFGSACTCWSTTASPLELLTAAGGKCLSKIAGPSSIKFGH
jgi:hypothetical protein